MLRNSEKFCDFSSTVLSRLIAQIKYPKMEQRWTDKIALITGANTGIGKYLVESLVSNGMKVVGIAPQIDKMKVCEKFL